MGTILRLSVYIIVVGLFVFKGVTETNGVEWQAILKTGLGIVFVTYVFALLIGEKAKKM